MSATLAAPEVSLLRGLPSGSKSLAALASRLGTRRGAYALHDAVAASRPAVTAALYRALGGRFFVIVPTPDVAERVYADLLYYLGDEGPRIATLMRSREETVGAIDSPSERSARMTLFAQLADGLTGIAVAPLAAVRQYVIPRDVFSSHRFRIERRALAGWNPTLERLHLLGYHRADVVSAAGEYAVRGGIIDLFAASADRPARIEFFGDEIESIREFDLTTQRSQGEIERLDVVPWMEIPRDAPYRSALSQRLQASPRIERAVQSYLEMGSDVPDAWLGLAFDERQTILDYLDEHAIVVLDEPGMLATIETALDEERVAERSVLEAGMEADAADAAALQESLLAEVAAPYPKLSDLGETLRRRAALVFPAGIESAHDVTWVPRVAEAFVFETRPAEHFNRQITLFTDRVRDLVGAGERVAIVTSGVSRASEIISAAGLPRERIFIDEGNIEAGFSAPDLRLHVLGDREIYGQPPKRVKLRAIKEGVPVTLADLKVGEYVVHAVHGIAQYLGLRTETVLGATQDYLDLRYAGTDRMLVPVTQMHQVTKYSAREGEMPRLSKMGGADWARTKSRVSESLGKIAEGLVELYAQREMARGHGFAADTPWQAELEDAFEYAETPDQQKAIDETKADMERDRPMDRLICGDVGYGKTEVAVRAAFKAVADKKQVAVLVPTTLLAAQHFRTFATRFAGFPLRIEELSRFKTTRAQREIVRDLAAGKVDVVIGTHRLLQKDIVFADLGLIVVDEEQRFGVMHKERLKELRASVDVLTLSATPIPRTLHMSLMGVRDLSLIQTAPENRLSIKTVVVPATDAIVQRAVNAELDRGGQVYYLHNRIESIYAVHNALQALVPRARIAVAHGQMREQEIEPIMQRFIDGEIDVLIATTIIENGIDIPNVNTIVVNDADKFGLAQLYQLRGRVGRSNHQAYAYLLYAAHKALTEDAKARLEAIREFTHLGSGLQIAMRDLEIRGAGNLLGSAQSGFIA